MDDKDYEIYKLRKEIEESEQEISRLNNLEYALDDIYRSRSNLNELHEIDDNQIVILKNDIDSAYSSMYNKFCEEINEKKREMYNNIDDLEIRIRGLEYD